MKYRQQSLDQQDRNTYARQVKIMTFKIKFALKEYKNYEEMYQVVTAAAEIANRLRVNRNQAITECNNQGFKLTRISKDNKTLYAHFIHRNKERRIKIKINETGTTVTYNLP